MNQALRDLVNALDSANRIAILLHISPDGDTCGSALALRRAFVLRGKHAVAVCDDPVPRIYAHLWGADAVVTPEAVLGETFDLALAVDVGDRGRLGRAAAVFDRALHTAQVDHHGTNPGYAHINHLQTPLSATGVLAERVIDALGVPIDLEIARCLYIAVVTDTGNFKQQNTDAAALRLGARCLDAGVDPSAETRRVFDLRPLNQTKLLGRALSNLEVFEGESLALMPLKREDFAKTGAAPEHTEGLVNFAINTEGVRIACLISEQDASAKCSLRAVPPFDVARIAIPLGGGGHTLAAGCVLPLPFDEAYETIRAAMRRELDRLT